MGTAGRTWAVAAAVGGVVFGLQRAAWGQAAPGANPGNVAARRDIARTERSLDEFRRDTRVQASKDVPIGQRALVDYGAYLTLSYLSFDDRVLTNHGLRQYDLTAYGRVDIDGANDFYLRGRTFYQDWNSGDALEDRPDHLEGRIEEAYWRFDYQRYMGAYNGVETQNKAVITVGRQFTEWASGLTLSQYVDAVRGDFQFGAVDVTALAGITASYSPDFDTSRPDFDNDTRRAYYGLMGGVQVGRFRPYAYGLVQSDLNSTDPLKFAGITTNHQYDSWYVGGGVDATLTDRLIFKSELTYEGGSGLSNSINSRGEPIPQTKEDIQAGAADFQLIYVLQDERRTRFSAELILATGDPDRQDTSNTFQGNQPGTKDHAFNGLGYLYDGLAFAPVVSNVAVGRVGVSTFPFAGRGRLLDKFQLGVDVFGFSKLRRNGGFSESTDGNYYLGVEPDVSINWQILEDVTVTARYGIFFPGGAVEADDEVRQFIYVAVTYAF